MKIQILQENLNKALNTASRSVSAKAQLPVLGNVLLATENGRLKITSTNLETGVVIWVGAKIEKDGEITIPARVITEIVSSLAPGKIDLDLNGSVLSLSTDSYQAKLNGIPAGEFPKLPEYEEESLSSLPFDLLTKLIGQVAFAAATDDGRPVLTGVMVKTNGDNLSMVATDGYRLSIKTVVLPEKPKKDFTLLIPAKTLFEIQRIIAEEKIENGMVRVGFTKEQNQAVFVFGDLILFSRLIEGEFPDYEKIIPKTNTSTMTVDRESLNRAVKVVSIFARESANIIRFNANKDGLELSANSPQVGENKNKIEGKLSGEDFEIAFNFRFLQGYLGAIEADQVLIEANGSLSPGVFKSVGDDSLLHIIMPVRLQTEGQ